MADHTFGGNLPEAEGNGIEPPETSNTASNSEYDSDTDIDQDNFLWGGSFEDMMVQRIRRQQRLDVFRGLFESAPPDVIKKQGIAWEEEMITEADMLYKNCNFPEALQFYNEAISAHCKRVERLQLKEDKQLAQIPMRMMLYGGMMPEGFTETSESYLEDCDCMLEWNSRDTEVLLLKAQLLANLTDMNGVLQCIRRCESILGQVEEIEEVKNTISTKLEMLTGTPMDWDSIERAYLNEESKASVGEPKTNNTDMCDNEWLKEHYDMHKSREKEEARRAKRTSRKAKSEDYCRDTAPVRIDISDPNRICDNMRASSDDANVKGESIKTETKFKEMTGPKGKSKRKERKGRRKTRLQLQEDKSETSSVSTDTTDHSTRMNCQGPKELSKPNSASNLQYSPSLWNRPGKYISKRSTENSSLEGYVHSASQSRCHTFPDSNQLLTQTLCGLPNQVMVVCLTCWKYRNSQLHGRSTDNPDYCANPNEPSRHRWSTKNKAYLMKSERHGVRKWIQVRPLHDRVAPEHLTQLCKFDDCREGKLCPYPHSEEERLLWNFQFSSNVKSGENLENMVAQNLQPKMTDRFREGGDSDSSIGSTSMRCKDESSSTTANRRPEKIENHQTPDIYCELCPQKTFMRLRDLDAHLASREHQERRRTDCDRFWKFRSPPWHAEDASVLKICPSVERGEAPLEPTPCEFAHSEEELLEWKQRVAYRQMKKQNKENTRMSLLHKTMRILSHSCSDIASEIVEDSQDAKICISGPLHAKGKLQEVGLLLDPCRDYFSFDQGSSFDDRSNSQILLGEDVNHANGKYSVTVKFAALHPGIYNQWVVFDFGNKPLIVKRLAVTAENENTDNDAGQCYRGILEEVFNKPLVDSFNTSTNGLEIHQHPNIPGLYGNVFLQSQMISWWDYRYDTVPTNAYYRLKRQLCLKELQEELHISRFEIRGNMRRADCQMESKDPDQDINLTIHVSSSILVNRLYKELDRASTNKVLVSNTNAPEVNDGPFSAVISRESSYNTDHISVMMKESHALKMGLTDGLEINVLCKPLYKRETFAWLNWSLEAAQVSTMFPNCKAETSDIDIPHEGGIIYGITLDSNQARFLMEVCKDSFSRSPVLLLGSAGTGKTELLDLASVILMKKRIDYRKNRILLSTNSIGCCTQHLVNVIKYLEKAQVLMDHVKPVMVLPKEHAPAETAVIPGHLKAHIVTWDEYQKTGDNPQKNYIVITTVRGSPALLQNGMMGGFSHLFIDDAGQIAEWEAVSSLALACSRTRLIIAGDINQGQDFGSEVAGSYSLLQRYISTYVEERSTGGATSVCLMRNYRSAADITNYINHYLYKQISMESMDVAGNNDVHHPIRMVIPMKRPKEATVTNLRYWQVLEVAYYVERLYRSESSDVQECDLNNLCIVVESQCQIGPIEAELRHRHLPGVPVYCIEDSQGLQFNSVLFVLANESEDEEQATVPFRGQLLSVMSRTKYTFTIMTSPDVESHSKVKNERSEVLQEFFRYCFCQNSISSVYQVRQPGDIGLPEDNVSNGQLGKISLPTNRDDFCDLASSLEYKTEADMHDLSIDTNPTESSASPLNLEEILFPNSSIPFDCSDGTEDDGYDYEEADPEWYLHFGYTWYDDDEDEEYNPDKHALPPNYYQYERSDEEYTLFNEYSKEQCKELLKAQPHKYKCCRLEIRPRERDRVVPLDEELDFQIRIPNRLKRGRALNQDMVLIELMDEDGNFKENDDNVYVRYGCVVGILERYEEIRLKEFACTLDEYSDGLMVPINDNFPKMIWWREKNRKKSSDDKVCIPIYKVTKNGRNKFLKFESVKNAERKHKIFLTRFLKWDKNNRYPTCVVVGVLPKVTDWETGLQYLKTKHSISNIIADTEQIADGTCSSEDRIDLRNVTTFTIDPTTSKDLDDAISISKMDNDNFKVGVHIADVASKVPIGSQLDNIASKRGTSYYPLDASPISMLPASISKNICSLLPNEDRNTVSFLFEVTSRGNVVDFEIKRALIRSHHKFSYDDVENIILRKNVDAAEFETHLLELHQIAQARRRTRLGKAYFLKEPNNYVEDENNTPLSHQLIEEFMVMTNLEVAKWLINHHPDRIPLRRQLSPAKEKFDEWYDAYSGLLHCSVNLSSKLPQPEGDVTGKRTSTTCHLKVLKEFVAVLKETADSAEFEDVKQLLCGDSNYPDLYLMALKFYAIQDRAEYICSDTLKNSEHFSLKAPAYVQCTSPIRRYMDLIVQRIIVATLDQEESPYNKQEVTTLCMACNYVEDKRRCFDRDSKELFLALKLQQNPVKAFAAVDGANENSLDLQVMKMSNIAPREKRLPLGLFKVSEKPVVVNEKLKLRWNEKLYDCKHDTGDFITVAAKKKTITLRSDHDFITEETKHFHICLKNVLTNNESQTKLYVKRLFKASSKSSNAPHMVEISSERRDKKGNRLDPCEFSRHFQKGDVLRVQVGVHYSKGCARPTIELISLSAGFDICTDHRKDPVRCFSTIAMSKIPNLEARKQMTINEYINRWLPILSMSAADNSVRQYENYIISNVDIQWMKLSGSEIEGNFLFQLPFVRVVISNLLPITIRKVMTMYVCVTSPTRGTNIKSWQTSEEVLQLIRIIVGWATVL
ncbi:3'-5' exoribonuclease HELZ2-like [Ptychodera flava]|uniref:3'-5' exoribonuclease HELZ2-like n=1 Tax=Ptychodera flava TaxID=63121 RepID=UPI00396A7BE1